MAILKIYTISIDITAGTVDADSLSKDIDISGHITNFTGLGVNEDNLLISGDSINDLAALDDLVSVHTGIPEYSGNEYTESQMLAIKKPIKGQRIYNNDRDRYCTFNGFVWLDCHTEDFINDSNEIMEDFFIVKRNSSYDKCDLSNINNDQDIIGVIVNGGEHGEHVSVASTGRVKVMMKNNFTAGQFVSQSNVLGKGLASTYRYKGQFGILLESGSSGTTGWVQLNGMEKY
jgi:hypothetical protein